MKVMKASVEVCSLFLCLQLVGSGRGMWYRCNIDSVWIAH